MNEVVKEILNSHGIKNYALVPVEGGVLVMYFAPYLPFDYSAYPECLMIDSYYLTSNRVYFENLKLIEDLKRAGLDAKRYRRTDIKELLTRYGLADFGMNELCFVKEYGSFFFVATVFLEAAETEFFSTLPAVSQPLCTRCGKCAAVCPQGALAPDGFKREKCLRQIQETYSDTEENNKALKKNGRLLGCNICQLACPLNSHVEKVAPPTELAELCDKKNILDTVQNEQTLQRFTPLIGKNYARKSFLLPLTNAFFK